MSAAAFRALLEAGDVKALRKAWAQVAPHLPQVTSDEQAEIVMHMTRTSSTSVRFRFRAYSHRWLSDRDLPSQLPDELKPKAERRYPKVVEGVGISLNTKSELLKPVIGIVRGEMEKAVEEAYADNRTEPEFVTQRMGEARRRAYKSLLGVEI
jgi:hypothetical protein